MEKDKLFEDVAKLIVKNKKCSASFIQIEFKLGYHRAEEIIDQLEYYGIIGEFKSTFLREVLFTNVKSLNIFLNKIKENISCPKCINEENFHFNYDYSKKDLQIIDILCNECGESFKLNKK